MSTACRAPGGLADVGSEKATASCVTFLSRQYAWSAKQSSSKLCSARRRRFRGFLGRFGDLRSFSAWSRHEDIARSGGNAGVSPFFVFPMKVVNEQVVVCCCGGHEVTNDSIGADLYHQQLSCSCVSVSFAPSGYAPGSCTFLLDM
ncbi:hypothetical protein Taro_044366 [Colocasia esculenta]|uniref:Uncharacterized protein n=1 Tax=Colocasia esculenta TaxID=4460 RepID=A0A843WLQ9_COLES|nr:hypothetical protein [Colocasia esculenta]